MEETPDLSLRNKDPATLSSSSRQELFSVAFGAIIYYLVLQVVLWMGLNSNDLKLLSALVVAVFLAIPYMKGKYFSKPVKRGGAPRA